MCSLDGCTDRWMMHTQTGGAQPAQDLALRAPLRTTLTGVTPGQRAGPSNGWEEKPGPAYQRLMIRNTENSRFEWSTMVVGEREPRCMRGLALSGRLVDIQLTRICFQEEPCYPLSPPCLSPANSALSVPVPSKRCQQLLTATTGPSAQRKLLSFLST